MGCGPWGRKESDTTEALHFHFPLSCIGEGNGNHSSVLAWRIPGTGELVACPLWVAASRTRLKRLSSSSRVPVVGGSAGNAQRRSPTPAPPAGPQFWSFQDRLLEGAARPLTELGLPPGEEVDAVFSWPLNGKTYLIRGRLYWRYDEAAARPDPGYPRDLSLWEGAPPAPDDVTVSNTGGRARAPGELGDGGRGAVGW